MRKVVLGMVITGLMLPALASAQDEGQRRDHPRKWAEQRGDSSVDRDGDGAPRPPQPQARSQPQPQPRDQAQPQDQPRYQSREQGGGERGGFRDGRPDGDPRAVGQRPAAPDGAGRRDGRDGDRDRDRDRFAPGRSGGDRFDRPSPGADAFRAQGGPRIAPGSGGYRPQPGQFGYDRGRPGAPGFGSAAPRGREGGWSRGWRDDRRFDYRQYRTRNSYLYRLPRYQVPRGWGYGYRRFTPGLTLSAVLFDRDYWIDDPFAYRLPPASGPYRWVRYYNDALLVDLRGGEVVDTVFDLFW